MASFSEISKTKRARRQKNAGKARKARMGRRSTISYDELFDGFGEPGKPVDAKSGKTASAGAQAKSGS